MARVILHCDMNNYFAAVEEKYNPALRSIPFAVCGDPEMRHSVVMSKNALAKQAGVLTGLSFRQARDICPQLEYVRADYRRYLSETKQARAIYAKYTDTVIPYGLDESWLDLTETGATMEEGRQIADLLRLEIMYAQGLSASVGVSDNLIFAKLGSDYKKPNATTVITRDNYRSLVWPLPVSELLFVGEKRKRALAGIGIRTIGDMAQADPSALRRLLGKAGHDLWHFANGDDRGFRPQNDRIGSIGNTITPPEDIHTTEDASALLYLLVHSVCARLYRHRMKACRISVSMKDCRFNMLTRQCSIPQPTDHINTIFNLVFSLFLRHYPWAHPLRAVGVRVDHLIPREHEQLSFFDPGDHEICVDIDTRVQNLTARLGPLQTEPSAAAAGYIE